MECKDARYRLFVDLYRGFNRDIVECKDSTAYNGQRSNPSFNRDIVECKVICIFEEAIEVHTF